MRLHTLGSLITLTLGFFIWSPVETASGETTEFLVAQADQGALNDSLGFNLNNLTDKEKLRYANDTQEEMREALASLQKTKDDARKAKDIVYLNCLNEINSSINALLKVTETATILMQDAVNQNNSQQVDHQFRKVYIARLKAQQLFLESEGCLNKSGEGLDKPPGEDTPTIMVEEPLLDTEITGPDETIIDPGPSIAPCG